ncbi:GLIPR1-like protein 1 [Dama dama]
MILRKKLSYLWTLGLCLVASKSPPKVPSITNETFIAECVRFHNEARTNVSPPAANMKYMRFNSFLDSEVVSVSSVISNNIRKPFTILIQKSFALKRVAKETDIQCWKLASVFWRVELISSLWSTMKCPVSWDEALAKTAEAWAKRCKFNHNSCSTQVFKCHPTFQLAGENLWLGPLTASVTKFAVDMWYDERKFYDFNTKSCSKICGHYTQVVWASSFKVGCAVAICPNLGSPDTALFVCNYALVWFSRVFAVLPLADTSPPRSREAGPAACTAPPR